VFALAALDIAAVSLVAFTLLLTFARHREAAQGPSTVHGLASTPCPTNGYLSVVRCSKALIASQGRRLRTQGRQRTLPAWETSTSLLAAFDDEWTAGEPLTADEAVALALDALN
jgi:hypothetical protein